MSFIVRLPIAALVGTLVSCNSAPEQASRSEPGRSTETAGVDKEAEVQHIRGLEARWREALTAKDSAAVAGFYAEDGFYLPQGSDGYRGPGQVSARWTGEFTGGTFELEREPKKVEVADAGDMAYEVGTYQVRWDKPSRSQRGEGAGNYVTVWTKEKGEWRTAAYIWNRGPER
jgi:uncharacterized protein (TIGR02246 family)